MFSSKVALSPSYQPQGRRWVDLIQPLQKHLLRQVQVAPLSHTVVRVAFAPYAQCLFIHPRHESLLSTYFVPALGRHQ